MAEESRLKHLLLEFKQDLEELGLPVQYLAPDSDRPLPSVIVQAPPDAAGRERSVLLAFIPEDGEFEEFDLMQLYMVLPVSMPDKDLAPQLLKTNRTAVLGHAGATEREVYWRHIWPIPRGLPIIPSVLLEVIQFFVFSAELGTKSLLKE